MSPQSPEARFDLAIDTLRTEITRLVGQLRSTGTSQSDIKPRIVRLQRLKVELKPTDTDRVSKILGGEL